MKVDDFKKALERAAEVVKDAEKSPFSGWGLYTRSEKLNKLLEWIDLGQGTGCTSSSCLHNSHSPFAHYRAAVPRSGVKVLELGYEGGFIYALLVNDEIILCRVVRPQHHWAHIDELEPNELSKGMQAEVAKKLGL